MRASRWAVMACEVFVVTTSQAPVASHSAQSCGDAAIKKMFSLARSRQVPALVILAKAVCNCRSSEVHNAVTMALFVGAPARFTGFFVDRFPVNRSAQRDLYANFGLRGYYGVDTLYAFRAAVRDVTWPWHGFCG
jgi:hypothetical protein